MYHTQFIIFHSKSLALQHICQAWVFNLFAKCQIWCFGIFFCEEIIFQKDRYLNMIIESIIKGNKFEKGGQTAASNDCLQYSLSSWRLNIYLYIRNKAIYWYTKRRWGVISNPKNHQPGSKLLRFKQADVRKQIFAISKMYTKQSTIKKKKRKKKITDLCQNNNLKNNRPPLNCMLLIRDKAYI